jgi:Ca2+-binding RTX toxin-like protein
VSVCVLPLTPPPYERRVSNIRRSILLLAAMALTLLVASGVALAVNKIGTNGPDTLKGTNGADNLYGRGGNDALFGFAGRDNLLGGAGKDWVLGGNDLPPLGGDKNLVGGRGNDGIIASQGSDNLVGSSGNDFLDGGRGSDNIIGQEGTDLLIQGPGRETAEDSLSGGDGNDVFLVDNEPATRDLVTCGGGFDRVVADAKDVVAPDCEKVAVGDAAVEELFEELDEGFFETFFGGLAPFPEG